MALLGLKTERWGARITEFCSSFSIVIGGWTCVRVVGCLNLFSGDSFVVMVVIIVTLFLCFRLEDKRFLSFSDGYIRGLPYDFDTVYGFS